MSPSLQRLLPWGVGLAMLLAAFFAAQVGLQLQTLSSLRDEIAGRETMAKDAAARAGANAGVALLAAPPALLTQQVAARVRQQAAESGIRVSEANGLDRRAGGANLQIVRISLRGRGDAASVDRFVRWIDRNSASIALERLILAAPQDGAGLPEFNADVAVLAVVGTTP